MSDTKHVWLVKVLAEIAQYMEDEGLNISLGDMKVLQSSLDSELGRNILSFSTPADPVRTRGVET